MTKSKNEIDELKALEREAAKRRPPQKRSRSSARTPVSPSQTETATDAAIDPVPKAPEDVEQATETEETLYELAEQIEFVVKEMEQAARERPAIALLSAFAVGIVVGQIFARR
ncbi:hypothetical protein CA13_27490 [Planctomycetes bacterium CA13]|uniref:DUF883 domain-containing protein n=1 Tax=Novipirellula herctigrandis TaxID=2527986 RepID=A0A5C5Z1P9_9BACT|nr:hypothetical protein CA13_27490 [Planctomycetes bacterium CA13]